MGAENVEERSEKRGKVVWEGAKRVSGYKHYSSI